jgi:hypothetical protein
VSAAVLAIGILESPARKTLKLLAPMFANRLACVAWSRAIQPAYEPTWTPRWTRPLIALDAIAFYLCKLFVPTKLSRNLWPHAARGRGIGRDLLRMASAGDRRGDPVATARPVALARPAPGS